MSKPKKAVHFSDSLITVLWPLLLITGLLVRVVVYWQNRSLFLDEANLARNIAEVSFAGCFQPLAYQQYAPPFFLLLEKLNWTLLGPSELSLRCWPLIMGCLMLYAMYVLLKGMSGGGLTGLFVFYLFAFSQVFIRYSTELKQYGTDMAVTTGLVWAALHFIPDKRKHLALWLVLGGISIWLSMPSVFVLAGIGCYFAYQWWEKHTVPVLHLILLGGFWLANFSLYYWLILGNDLQKTELLDYHQTYFWPLFPTQAADWHRLLTIGKSLLSTLIGHTFIAILLGMIGLGSGLIYLWKKERARLWIFALPVALCLFASGLGLYSLMERLSLFLMPLLGMILLQGLLFLSRHLNRPGLILLLLAGILVMPLRKGVKYFFSPLQYEEMRPLLTELDQVIMPDDLLWVDHYAQAAYRWYTEYAPLPIRLSSRPHPPIFNTWDGTAITELSDRQPESGRIWLVFSHIVSAFNRQEMEQDLELMRRQWGEPEIVLTYPGVAAFGWQAGDQGM